MGCSMSHKVLVVGGGGREHAIVWKLSKSPKVGKLYCAPGNAGIAQLAECYPVEVTDIAGMVALALSLEVDLAVVAPDDPLAAGLVDKLEESGIRAFGPNKAAAIIESSKAFSKDLMMKYGIPTARYAVFLDEEEALAYLETQPMPIVVKADGLALGKGVLICETLGDAKNAVSSMLKFSKFGKAGSCVVIEEFLQGPEVSILAFSDGNTVLPMESAQDYKRANDNDEGKNTGGMGAFSPSPLYTAETAAWCMERIFLPTINAMNSEERPFKGVIYFGLMLTADGPKVIEYNARFGDPEAQVVLMRLENDLFDVFNAVLDDNLKNVDLRWKSEPAVCVVMASGGYPEHYVKGYPISGLTEAGDQDGTIIFHSGTMLKGKTYLTNGGRVLGVTALGKTMNDARMLAYAAVSRVDFSNAHWRMDIAQPASSKCNPFNNRTNNVVLIGMPSAGKSTLGVLAAKVLGKNFIDTDILLQMREGERLQTIINKHGLKYFLSKEQQAVLSVNDCDTIIATGGSVIYSEAAISHLKEYGKLVYLKVPLPELERRLGDASTRGIVMDVNQTFAELYNERDPLYTRHADIIIDWDGKAELRGMVEELIRKLQHSP